MPRRLQSSGREKLGKIRPCCRPPRKSLQSVDPLSIRHPVKRLLNESVMQSRGQHHTLKRELQPLESSLQAVVDTQVKHELQEITPFLCFDGLAEEAMHCNTSITKIECNALQQAAERQ